MKTFIVSLLIFSLLLITIARNAIFVNGTMDKLEQTIKEMPTCETASDMLREAETLWREKRSALALSVSYGEIRDVDVSLVEMRAAIDAGDALQFETARLTALGAIDDIRRLERIAPFSIA